MQRRDVDLRRDLRCPRSKSGAKLLKTPKREKLHGGTELSSTSTMGPWERKKNHATGESDVVFMHIYIYIGVGQTIPQMESWQMEHMGSKTSGPIPGG